MHYFTLGLLFPDSDCRKIATTPSSPTCHQESRCMPHSRLIHGLKAVVSVVSDTCFRSMHGMDNQVHSPAVRSIIKSTPGSGTDICPQASGSVAMFRTMLAGEGCHNALVPNSKRSSRRYMASPSIRQIDRGLLYGGRRHTLGCLWHMVHSREKMWNGIARSFG